MTATRDRVDRCPGVLRPWIADDGALLRIRLIGGLLSRSQLSGLAGLAASYGDGSLHLTSHANVQLRAFPSPVPDAAVSSFGSLGLLPHPSHELVRNVLVSPLTGISGGVVDVRPLAHEYDELLCASADLAGLSARFLVAFDDRDDITRDVDLRALAVSRSVAHVYAAGVLVDEVPLASVPSRLIELARWFVGVRGTGETAAWHIADLPDDVRVTLPASRELTETVASRASLSGVSSSFTTGVVKLAASTVTTIPFPTGEVTPFDVEAVLAIAGERIIVTPERTLLLPDAVGAC